MVANLQGLWLIFTDNQPAIVENVRMESSFGGIQRFTK